LRPLRASGRAILCFERAAVYLERRALQKHRQRAGRRAESVDGIDL
jgi:hypothetical protein